MITEKHIEELRAELRNAVDPTKRHQIELELERASTELKAIIAEQEQCPERLQPI